MEGASPFPTNFLEVGVGRVAGPMLSECAELWVPFFTVPSVILLLTCVYVCTHYQSIKYNVKYTQITGVNKGQ